MQIVQLYQDYGIDYVTEGHKHCRPGWINTPCPFCTGNPGYHLGYNEDDNYYYCWRCGWHPVTPTIAKLLNTPIREVPTILTHYNLVIVSKKTGPIVKPRVKAHRMPSGTGPIDKIHRTYLEKRKYDPDEIERTWNIVGTGPVSLLDGIDYKFRIIAPVVWNDQQVSFQARDITNKDPNRYRACPKDRELIHHKHIVYGRPDMWGTAGICCEGITDVWRLGTNAFCTFGIKYTPRQVRVIAQTFKRVFIMFDQELQAQKEAAKLEAELKFRGVEALRTVITDSDFSDPGSMTQNDADWLVKQLIK